MFLPTIRRVDRRRFLLTLLSGALPTPAAAQGRAPGTSKPSSPGRLPRVGYVGSGHPSDPESLFRWFAEGLRTFDYVEGRTVTIVWIRGRPLRSVAWPGRRAGEPRCPRHLHPERSHDRCRRSGHPDDSHRVQRDRPDCQRIRPQPGSSGPEHDRCWPGSRCCGTRTAPATSITGQRRSRLRSRCDCGTRCSTRAVRGTSTRHSVVNSRAQAVLVLPTACSSSAAGSWPGSPFSIAYP